MQIQSYQKIQLLPEHVIDQIKAGEVVERPAHIIKELIENSIDAGSTKIEITLLNNGLDLIVVKDNGHGIEHNELPLAFCRHATSKLNQFDDIYSLSTFGFRGEALASLASVSKMTCQSYVKSGKGSRIQSEGPLIISHVELTDTAPSGTEIYIKELFFNTPARLKFMNSQRSEKNYLTKVIHSYLVANPQIEFHIKWDENDKLLFPKREKREQRASDIINQGQHFQWLSKTQNYDNYSVTAYISSKALKGKSKLQYVFVNNRPIYDKQIQAILQNLSNDIWGPGLSGHSLIFITAHPSAIDVNIHPHKTQVKFNQTSEILALLRSVVKELIPSKQNEKNNLPLSTQPHSYNQENFLPPLEQAKDLKPSINYSLELSESYASDKESTIKKINQDYALVQTNSTYTLISLPKILRSLFEQNLKEESEERTTPLLISIPIKTNWKIEPSYLKELAAFGFVLDPINEKNYLLREIPRCFDKLRISTFLEHLFSRKVQLTQFFNHLENYSLLTPSFLITDIEVLFQSYTINNLIKENLAVELNTNNLSQLFKN